MIQPRTGPAAAAAGAVLLSLLVTACAGHSAPRSAPAAVGPASTPVRRVRLPVQPRRVSPLRLPLVRSRTLPGYLLVADRNNDRVLLLSPRRRIVWQVDGLDEPDDAFFTPGFRSVITNEEFADTLTEISLRTRTRIWSYGHAGSPGSSPGYLHSPDDAYRLGSGVTTVADIANCRIVQLRRDGTVLRVLGGSCVHNPPRGFASPNGDTPLPDGGLLVTEIGGWIDRLDRAGRLVWSVRSPISYPSDAQLLGDGRILVCGFTTPGRVVELTRTGRVVWSFGSNSGPDRLDRPSLAIRLPSGLIAVNDDWRHRVILVDPRSGRIVWQYGHTDVAGSSPGYLDKPDGMDFLPAAATRAPVSAPNAGHVAREATAVPSVEVVRAGTLPHPVSRLAAVSLPGGRIVALGGLVAGSSTNEILGGVPAHLRLVGRLPAATHDAAAVALRGRVFTFGGGESTSTSTSTVTSTDPRTAATSREPPLDEPLSDLGAVVVGGRAYLVGGYTGSRYASAVLRVGPGDRTTTVARLPAGLRYAGVTAVGRWVYVAGGLTTAGPSSAVYRIDVRRGTVARLGRLPHPVAHAPLVAARGALWLIGGATRDIVRIDPTNGSSFVAGRLPGTLADAAATALSDGRIAVIGGDGSATVWTLVPR